ncbi:MAG: ABC transporter permease [Anaerolineae bacterium]|jgi:ribose transport system permease protein
MSTANQAAGSKTSLDVRSMIKRVTDWREFNVVLAVILLSAVLAASSDAFLTTANLFSVMRAFSLTAIMAVGQTIVILTAGIDLSVGSIMGLSGLLTAMIIRDGYPVELAVVAGLVTGSGVGLCNGLMITKLRLPPFIATLGTLSMGRGLMYWITHGWPVTLSFEHPFLSLGQGYVGPIPVPVIVMLALYIAAAIFLSRTSIGRYIYAVGGNEQAARFSGIRVSSVKVLVYTISGFCCAISGLILLARMVSAQPMAGLGYELPVIAACAIGGTSLMGGEGTILGTLMGAALMGILQNGMVLVGIDTYAQQAVTGAVIVIAVTLDQWRQRRMAQN